MDNTFLTALMASLVAAVTTTLGIVAIRRFAEWGRRNSVYFIAFAAGVLITASFLHIIPRALSMNGDAPAWLLAGFLALHVVNRVLERRAGERDLTAGGLAFGIVPMIGIGFHSLIDGIVYSVAFTVSVFTGFLATAGMVLHEFPEGIITYLLLVRAGLVERRAALLAFLAAAATTPVGMLASWPIVSELRGEALGALLALSAGALVYVGATHLLPHATREHGRHGLLALSAGVVVTVLVIIARG